MPFALTMPKLTPTMEMGVIAKWHKKEGEFVESGEVVLEITTDKATVEHTALDEGYLRKILVSEGQEVSVNTPLAVFSESQDEDISSFETPKPEASQKPAESESTVEEKQEEKQEAPSQPKAAAMSGPAFVPEPELTDYTFEFPLEKSLERIKASPLAKKLAAERDLDLTTVKGSGPGGRIVEADLDKAQKNALFSFGVRKRPTDNPGAYEEKPLSSVQKVVATRLQQSKTFIPHFYIDVHVNATPIIDLRNELKELGIKLSFNDFITKACATALKKHPKVNSGFNSVTESLIHFKTVDIAIAVSLDEGLITPIIRHADFKNIAEISVEVKDLAKRARIGKLALEEFKGGSFTISNLGMYGIATVKPVINPPQSSILGVGGLEDFLALENGSVVSKKRMTLTLAADHRAVNGADGAEFLQTLQFLLEHPTGLLL